MADPKRVAPPASVSGSLAGYEVLVCVCGGVAAYKVAAVVSQLVQSGCGVNVAMTRAARKFIGAVTFQALTGRAVHTSLWPATEGGDIAHLKLSERADLLLVAPATANVLGKLASGIADDLVSSLLLGSDCPVLLAPAMNTRMWQHPAVQRSVEFLRQHKFAFIGPGSGWQACRAVGHGRMSEPDEIVAMMRESLLKHPPRHPKNAE
ncbi:MAG: flavoprotein [Phycisphaerae bacterium]